ncbi:ATPase [Actinomyces sp. Chiba101]|uniref:Uncharacterized protein n=1 Tax=Actinomyces denticolens TaxID=52767 RepID=A0ABY1I1P7_9ACTO|nr:MULTISPECIES: hypothetical protein [Actinomyces]BAW93623.1 ATPase [Actinomyces sp. Chiba101]GAV93529.1 V-type ATPase 116 kDa subunit [Actinomyces denticolens]SHI33182.1 hypothetical protein SAMN05216246_101259 [Actinomyces denticolens]SUU74579.1 Uncharacterised protein [Actinomyces denticolens]
MTVRYETYTDEKLDERRAEIRRLIAEPDFQERRDSDLLLPREQALLDELEDLEFLSHDARAAS